MNTEYIVIAGLFILTLLALAGSLYAVSLIRKRNYKAHIRIHNILFIAVTAGVIIFEVQLRLSGGSGSLLGSGPLTQTSLFKGILIAHILGALLTFGIWTTTIIWSNRRYKQKKALGVYSVTHRRMGYATIGGLFYTVITAFAVCVMAFL